MNKIKLISITKPEIDGINTAQDLISYCARVSNPSNQLNIETSSKLIHYLIKNKHWSPLEMCSMCVEIKTSRAIAAQILRHRSFSFQEFSQRYAKVQEFESIELRLQGKTNRQVGDETYESEDINNKIKTHIENSKSLYNEMIDKGIAKESARFILPLNTQTTIFMSGTIRSWVHYLEIRTDQHTQKEHRELASQIKSIFIEKFPDISTALDWK